MNKISSLVFNYGNRPILAELLSKLYVFYFLVINFIYLFMEAGMLCFFVIFILFFNDILNKIER